MNPSQSSRLSAISAMLTKLLVFKLNLYAHDQPYFWAYYYGFSYYSVLISRTPCKMSPFLLFFMVLLILVERSSNKKTFCLSFSDGILYFNKVKTLKNYSDTVAWSQPDKVYLASGVLFVATIHPLPEQYSAVNTPSYFSNTVYYFSSKALTAF